jgi:tripartite-type tricarboxylate transporter receptor subunit TctC
METSLDDRTVEPHQACVAGAATVAAFRPKSRARATGLDRGECRPLTPPFHLRYGRAPEVPMRIRQVSPLPAIVAVACIVWLGGAPAVAQTYPDRLIRIVVPFAAGGPVDVVARLVAQRMASILGQSVIVENRLGGGGVIGAKAVANAEPDGYTLLFGNVSTLAVIPAVSRNKDYDPVKNFAPVAKVSDSPEVLVVAASFPARTVQELVTIAKKNPGELNFGSSGYGNATHLAAEWFKAKTAVDVVHIPYKGLSEVVTAVLAGQVKFVFGAIEGVMPHIQDGQLRALAVTSEKRFALLPELPTMIESGVDGFVVSSFQGVVAPAGTPAAVVAKLNAAVNASVEAPEMRTHLARLGATAATGTPQEFAAFFTAEMRKWEAVVKSAGVSVD